MANLSGREREEGVRRKRKRKEEKRRRGNKNQPVSWREIPKQLNHTQKHWEQEELHSNSTTEQNEEEQEKKR